MSEVGTPLERLNQYFQAPPQALKAKVRLVQSTEVIKAQENERRRIASELHDGIGQRLSALKYSVENLITSGKISVNEIEPLKNIVGGIRDSIEEVRRISRDLCPSILEDFGILVTINWLCREFQTNHLIQISKDISIEEADIKDTHKIVIFRIVQEALNNISKHAHAKNVSIVLHRRHGEISLQIKDDGCGFELDKKLQTEELPANNGIGLYSMRRRAEMSNGKCNILSKLGLGTMIQVLWPCTIRGFRM